VSRVQFDPTQHGIYRRLLADDGLHHSAWNRAVELGEHVGTCRWCGGYLLGDPTHQAGQITWLGGHCTNPQCGREFATPNGAALRRSSRHDEMPAGWWLLRAKKK
jgi:hypothetical protein